jgi:GT2 family glycosyltransferase
VINKPAPSHDPKPETRNPKPTTHNAQRITLLICTSGRPELLDRCLTAVEAGSELPEQLVVVNGIDGKTPAVVERHAIRFDEIVLAQHPNRNLATLRNLGLPYCTGDIIAMSDDDAVPEAGWTAAVRAAHVGHPEAGGVGGPVRGTNDSFLSRVADAVVFPDPKPGRPIHTLPTVNMTYKRAAIEAVGEFDETLFRGEDVDYNWRVIKAGYALAFEPAMRVRHEHRSTLTGLYQQQYMYGRAYVLVRSKWPEMYSVYPHSLRTPRSWAKLGYAALAIFYLPLGIARSLPARTDQMKAYPVLVVHHLVWKAGMLRQAVSMGAGGPGDLPRRERPVVAMWRVGEPVGGR